MDAQEASRLYNEHVRDRVIGHISMLKRALGDPGVQRSIKEQAANGRRFIDIAHYKASECAYVRKAVREINAAGYKLKYNGIMEMCVNCSPACSVRIDVGSE